MKIFTIEEAKALCGSEQVISSDELNNIPGRRPDFEEAIQIRSTGEFISKDFNKDTPLKVTLGVIAWIAFLIITYVGIVEIPFVRFDEHVSVAQLAKFVYFVLFVTVIDLELTHFVVSTFLEQKSKKLREVFAKDGYEIIETTPEGYIHANSTILKPDSDKVVVKLGDKYGIFTNIEGEYATTEECIEKDNAVLLRFKIPTNFGRTTECVYVVYVGDSEDEE